MSVLYWCGTNATGPHTLVFLADVIPVYSAYHTGVGPSVQCVLYWCGPSATGPSVKTAEAGLVVNTIAQRHSDTPSATLSISVLIG